MISDGLMINRRTGAEATDMLARPKSDLPRDMLRKPGRRLPGE